MNLKNNIWSRDCHQVPNLLLCTNFLKSKLDNYSWRYGDLMICKIAAIRHLEFLKFRVCVMRPLMPCYSPSLCKNSLKSENLLLSYGQKNDCLKWRLSAILNFRGAIMGSLKMPCRTSYWSSIETIILDCFVYEKIAFLSRRSPGMGSRTARSRPRPRPVSSRPRPRPVIMIVEKIKKK